MPHTTTIPKGLLSKRVLPGAEWLAENAFIAPGFHRLLTAGGLALGLWGGRRLMDIVTAHRSDDGQEIPRNQVPEIARPIHGTMRYNPYSDAAADRWKYVVDRLAPVAFGAAGAYWGGKLFFHGAIPGRAPFSPAAAAMRNAAISTEASAGLMRVAESDATRKWAAATFVEGSAMGMHIPGAIWPFNNGMIAVSFQQGAGRAISFPFLGRLNRLLGNNGATSRYLYGAMRDTTKWMEANILKFKPEETHLWATDENLLRRARDGLQHFYNRTPLPGAKSFEEPLQNALRDLIDKGHAHVAGLPQEERGKALFDFLSGRNTENVGLLGPSYDNLVKKAGYDLRNVKLAGDPFAFFSRLFGSRKAEEEIATKYAEYIKHTHGCDINVKEWVAEQVTMPPWKVHASYGAAAAGVGLAVIAGNAAASRMEKKVNHTTQNAPQEQQTGVANIINGKPLEAMHWLARVVITPPSMHRFMNAAYLSAALYGGMQVANAMTGRKLTKLSSGALADSQLMKEELTGIWRILRPLHNTLEYTPGSAKITDRWRQAAHYIIPVGVGMFGTYTGSAMFFRDRKSKLEKPQTLEDYADRIAMEQSKPYAWLTAITSIFNTGSGIHLVPFFNYSSNLHNRYLMASGQQVAMPGIGKWWSGNPGLTPWGVKRSLDFMTNYLTYNPDLRPREMPSLVYSVVSKLYPHLPEEALLNERQAILTAIYSVRDSYAAGGTIPEAKQPALRTAMQKLLSGQGFEMLLQDAGLNPAEADLASNGASGTIANFLGKRNDVAALQTEYRQTFAQRTKQSSAMAPRDYLRALAEHSGQGGKAMNDNATAQAVNDQTFAERVKQESKPANFAERLTTNDGAAKVRA